MMRGLSIIIIWEYCSILINQPTNPDQHYTKHTLSLWYDFLPYHLPDQFANDIIFLTNLLMLSRTAGTTTWRRGLRLQVTLSDTFSTLRDTFSWMMRLVITSSGEMTLRLWWPSLLLWSPTLIQMQLVQLLNAWPAKEIAKLRINESSKYISLKLAIMRIPSTCLTKSSVHVFEIRNNESDHWSHHPWEGPAHGREGVAQGNLYSQALVEVLFKVPCNRKPILQMVVPAVLDSISV